MKYLSLAVAACAAAVLMPSVASAGDQDFSLINKTGYEIREVYVSPHNASDWEEDVLGEDSLDDNTSVKIHFSRDTDTCTWDLKVVYTDDGSSAEWGNFDLCTISEVSIYYNEKTDKTWATWK
jgi:hypothetical protein